MNELHLSKNELLGSSEQKSSQSWIANYAADVWQNPSEHKTEIALGLVGVLGIATASTLTARRLIGQVEERKIGSLLGDGTLAKQVPVSPAERFYKMPDREVQKLVTDLQENHGIRLSSWGSTRIEGTENETLKVLRSSNGAALKVEQGEQTLFAHKINTSTTGDTTFSYYTRGPLQLKNPWITDEAVAWPLKTGGPVDGLKSLGAEILEMQKPRGFHYSPDLNKITFKWTDMKVTLEPRLASTLARSPGKQELGEITVSGKDAAITGLGEISVAKARFSFNGKF